MTFIDWHTQRRSTGGLPYLAGRILPALNEAICWELLIYILALSAGNLEGLSLILILRDYTPKCFCCLFALQTSFINKLFIRTKYTVSLPDLTEYKYFYNLPFSSYLAGLIEGDGTIVVPKTERSLKGVLNYACVQIVFHLKDLPLALIIQKVLGVGSLSKKKGVNAYILTINNYKGLILIVSLLNGNMRTPKIESLYNLIDWLNSTKNTSFVKKPLNNSPLSSNA